MAGERFPGQPRDNGIDALPTEHENQSQTKFKGIEFVEDTPVTAICRRLAQAHLNIGPDAKRSEVPPGAWMKPEELASKLSEDGIKALWQSMKYGRRDKPPIEEYLAYCSENTEGEVSVHVAIGFNKAGEVEVVRGTWHDYGVVNNAKDVMPLLAEKIPTLPGGDKFAETLADMCWLADTYDRHTKLAEGEELDLSVDEVAKLYQLFDSLKRFDSGCRDPRPQEILNGRSDPVADVNRVFQDERYQTVEGDINLTLLRESKGLDMSAVECRGGIACSFEHAEGIEFPETLGGGISVHSRSIKNVKLPRMLGGDLELEVDYELDSPVQNVSFPEEVGGDLYIKGLFYLDGINLPKIVGGDVVLKHLYSMESTEDFELPQEVGGDLKLGFLHFAEGVTFTAKVGGKLTLYSLEWVKQVELPEEVGGNLYLSSLYSAKGLKFPQRVKQHIYFDGIRDANEFTEISFPEEIGGEIRTNLSAPLGTHQNVMTLFKGTKFDRIEKFNLYHHSRAPYTSGRSTPM